MATDPQKPASKPDALATTSTGGAKARKEEGDLVIAAAGSRIADPMEQMFLDGDAIDRDLKRIPKMDPKDPRVGLKKPVILDTQEQIELKGELDPGDAGWIELDEKGSPVGTATNVPPVNKPAAPVVGVVESTPRVLATPGGAFLTDTNMQPSPQLYKYSSPAYNRDYTKMAEAVAARDGLVIPGDSAKPKSAA
jgi:hypothetical protein